MNAGRNLDRAIEQAKANAAWSGFFGEPQPRYVHSYNGVYWISKQPPKCPHRRVMPDGTVIDVDGCDSVILS